MNSERELIVTACQIDIELGNVSENAIKIAKTVGQNKLEKDQKGETPPQLFVFPECALTGYDFDKAEDVRKAAALSKIYLNTLAEELIEPNVYIIIGYVELNEDGTMYNAAVLLSPENGGKRYNYRKMHLPNVGLDRLDEVIESQDGFPVFDLPFGKLGMLICFDHGYPEPARILALNGAEFIVSIVNWGEGMTGPNVIQARAIDNGVAYLALNRVGTENGEKYIGESGLVDCNGNVLLSFGAQEQVASTAIKLGTGGGIESPIHPMNHRRPEFYKDLLKPVEAKFKGKPESDVVPIASESKAS